MLFRAAILEKIARGKVTVAFRYWRRPSVKAGGRLRTSVGELVIESVERCEPVDISERDVHSAGFDDRRRLLAELDPRAESKLYRISFHYDRADPRVALREQDFLDPARVEEIKEALIRLDKAAKDHSWTLSALRLIADQPGVLAKDIGAALAIEKEKVKRNVRKLKDLGLTESLLRGYRISPCGKAFLITLEREAQCCSDLEQRSSAASLTGGPQEREQGS